MRILGLMFILMWWNHINVIWSCCKRFELFIWTRWVHYSWL